MNLNKNSTPRKKKIYHFHGSGKLRDFENVHDGGTQFIVGIYNGGNAHDDDDV